MFDDKPPWAPSDPASDAYVDLTFRRGRVLGASGGDKQLGQLAQAAENLKRAWRQSIVVYREHMADQTRMPLARVRGAAKLVERVQAEALSKADKAIQAARDEREGLLEAVAFKPEGTPVESEIRSHIAARNAAKRMELLRTAIAQKDKQTLGAIFTAPAYLSGLGVTNFEILKAEATRELHLESVKRIERLQAGIDALARVGGVLLSHVEALLPSKLTQAPASDLTAARMAQELAEAEAERRKRQAEREFQRSIS